MSHISCHVDKRWDILLPIYCTTESHWKVCTFFTAYNMCRITIFFFVLFNDICIQCAWINWLYDAYMDKWGSNEIEHLPGLNLSVCWYLLYQVILCTTCITGVMMLLYLLENDVFAHYISLECWADILHHDL